jgi:hydrogenase maturation protease
VSLLVLGLGNTIHRDDAIGILVVRRLRELAENTGAGTESPGIPVSAVFIETEEMGLSLMDFLSGYAEVVVVDAVQTGKARPGTLHILAESDLKTLPGASPHYTGITEVLALGRALNLPMPLRVTVLAVEVADPFTVGEGLSPELQEAFPSIVSSVLQYIADRGISQ